MICREILNKETGAALNFKCDYEKQFFLLLKLKMPNAIITYEESMFMVTYNNGTRRGIVPDFSIQKDGTSKRIFIEITTRYKDKDHLSARPKEEKRKIMKLVAPDAKYVVLYREHLENIQRHYPWLDFFGVIESKVGKNKH